MISLRLDKAVFGHRSSGFTIGPVSLSVDDGDVVLVVGPNGSGKSTILRTIAGLHNLMEGEVACDLEGEGRQPRLGWVSDSRADLPGELTAGEIWELTARLMASDGCGAKDMIRRSEQLAAAFNIAHLSMPLRSLSHGTYKKVAIITALMAKRHIMLLDEPTAGLDDASVQALIKEIARQKTGGPVQFIATHDSRLSGIADLKIDLDGLTGKVLSCKR